MKVLTLAVAISLGLLAGCNRSETTPPSPKTDTSSATPSSASGSTTTSGTTSSANGSPSTSEKREGANPTQGQVDPKDADQHRDFRHKDDASGPQSSDAQPTSKN